MSETQEFTEQPEVAPGPAPEPHPEEPERESPFQVALDADLVVRTLYQAELLQEGAFRIDEATYVALTSLIGRAKLIDGEIVPYEPPAPPAPPPPLIVLTADVLFFDRMTDDEYDALDDSVRAGETARVYRGWSGAKSFTEGTDMWALLVKHLTPDPKAGRAGVTDERRAELLARP